INADFAPTLIKLISYYKSDYLYYRKLFWKIRPKAIFLLQNGVQRALIKAAHDLAIPVLEIQHGRVGFVHPVYSYNPKISYDHLTYFPDYFLSFSDYWNKNYFFPVENRRTIGNNHYYIHPAGNDRRTFTVVFINGLEKITRDLAGKCPDMTIYVKLRHSDEPMRHHYNRMFAGHPNIKVIFDEKNILDLYRISHSILAVESTAVYEALQSQTKVFIAMIRNYHTHEDVFSHKNVYLVKNATDIVKHINKPVKKDPDNIYFESFKTEKFQAVLKEIDELQNKKILHKGWKDVKECFLCGNKKFIPLYTVPDRHYGAKGHFHISQCKNCSLVFLNPMPGKEDLNRLYPQDSYYSYQNFLQKKKSWKYRLERFFIRIETKDPLLEPGKLLDIGCGSGSFLYDMRKKGWETFGVEISKNACDTGKRSGLNIFCGTLAEARFKKDQFDYIRSNHSFEHMVDPNRTLEEMRRILKPGGKVLIGVPHIKSMNATVFKEYWYYLGAPFHPFNYSVITLQKMLEKHGFIVEKVRYNSNYQGILGSLQIFVNRKTGRLSHEGNIINNHFLKVIFQWLARLLDLLHRGDCIEIIASKRSKR
ncbi:MAG: class I SAM-dependent methyltransferase, partial [Spirochaetes bacterium]|nr:class I SAM-dependent methyltransferase [Spirochaetota bacterium]